MTPSPQPQLARLALAAVAASPSPEQEQNGESTPLAKEPAQGTSPGQPAQAKLAQASPAASNAPAASATPAATSEPGTPSGTPQQTPTVSEPAPELRPAHPPFRGYRHHHVDHEMESRPSPQVRGYRHRHVDPTHGIQVESAPVYISPYPQRPIYPAAPPSPVQDVLGRNTRRAELYNILAALDPYKATPKEFIHLLVAGALDNEGISRAIYKMHDDRLRNPHTWQPIAGPTAYPAPAQPLPVNSGSAYSYGQPMQAHHGNFGPAPPPGSAPFPPGPIPPLHGRTTAPQPYSLPPPGPKRAPQATRQDQASGPAGYPPEIDEGEPREPREQSCNYTWVVDKAETLLGWTGNWDSFSKPRKRFVGQQSADKLLKLLQMVAARFEN